MERNPKPPEDGASTADLDWMLHRFVCGNHWKHGCKFRAQRQQQLHLAGVSEPAGLTHLLTHRWPSAQWRGTGIQVNSTPSGPAMGTKVSECTNSGRVTRWSKNLALTARAESYWNSVRLHPLMKHLKMWPDSSPRWDYFLLQLLCSLTDSVKSFLWSLGLFLDIFFCGNEGIISAITLVNGFLPTPSWVHSVF